ncbi:MAG: Tim44 domain-containing protein [Rubrivivax sp.]|nr:Tim44 domain-containing protein [Rubrivivax sp.]
MKNWFVGVVMAAVALAVVPEFADAKRLGGGASKGMQRSTPTQPAQNTPPSPATPANPGAAAPAAAGATAGAAAAAGKRSWMGPIAGLAAGLGLAALFSHLGLGAELANFVMIALLVAAAFFAFRFFMARRNGGNTAGPRLATATAGAGAGEMQRTPFQPLQPLQPAPVQPVQPTASAQPAAFTGLAIGSGVAAAQLPADFDKPAFERLAKMIFIRMQAANDTADINDLRNFTTPELFADLRLDIQERGPAAQHTDVVEVNAEVLDFAQEPERQIVSVHYQGKVVEAAGEDPVAFDEIWHLVKPTDDSRNWAIAGIQQKV